MTFAPAGPFPVDQLPDGRIRTAAPVTWTGHHGDAVHIPAGTISDGATRPWFTAAIVNQWGPASRGFLVHDVLCDDVNGYRNQLDAYTHRVLMLPGSQWGPRPEAPAFDAVDTDHVFRLILAELGTPTVLRWIYWTGVRYGALGNPARRAGWLRTLPLVAAWTLPTLAVLLPAVAGAWISRGLLALAELAAWPVTKCAPALRRPRPVGLRFAPGAPPVIGPADQVTETLAVLDDLRAAPRRCAFCPRSCTGDPCQDPL